MRRYYSHYTYIYPDIYLKNHIVELDDDNRISIYFPFEREIEKTEFYSGIIFFLPKFVLSDNLFIAQIIAEIQRKYILDVPAILFVEIKSN